MTKLQPLRAVMICVGQNRPAYLQLLGDKVEVEELEGDPDLPVGHQDGLHVLLQLGHNLMALALHAHVMHSACVDSQNACNGHLAHEADHWKQPSSSHTQHSQSWKSHWRLSATGDQVAAMRPSGISRQSGNAVHTSRVN